jgi:tetratricopeptide (TPR) repeat protein
MHTVPPTHRRAPRPFRTRLGAPILTLALGLSAPAAAQPVAPPSPAQSGDAEMTGAVTRAQQLLDSKKPLEALSELTRVTDGGDPDAPYYQELEFTMGRALVDLELYQAAFTWFERIAEQGDSHPRFVETIDWFLKLQQAVPGDTASLERLAEYDPLLYPPGPANTIRFLVGQHFYNVDDLGRAIESLEAVEAAAEEPYLKAQYLLGVIYTRRNEAQPALEAFRNILRYQRDVGTNEFVDGMAKRAILALARAFYTVGQFETAARYYDEIEQEDPAWLDSLFEISWTYFQIGNYERALGNLHTLNSPYFSEEYFPESLVLQAVILFTNCHFKEALAVVEQFDEQYKPLKEELELQLKQGSDPNQFYGYLARLSQEEEQARLSKRLKRVFNAALRDNKLRRLLRYVLQVDAEKARIETLLKEAGSGRLQVFLTSALADLTAYRGLVIGEAGQAAKTRLDRVQKELTELLSQALRVKFETLRAQRSLIAKMRTMSPEEVESQFGELPPPQTDDEHVHWPFEGEYWRDELGAYTFLIVDRCLDKKAAQDKAPPADAPGGQ